MDKMENLILEDLSEHVSVLKIHRPEVLNALNRETLHALARFFQQTRYHAPFRVLIVTGSGNKSFIAGADIKEMKEMAPLELLQFCELGQEVTKAFALAPFAIIAAVNGYALGGGLEIALAADFIYASSDAKLGLPEVSLGMIPGFGGMQRLSRAIGMRLAKEFVLSGRVFSAEEGLAMGAINRVCPKKDLLAECLKTANEIASHSLPALLQAKRAIDVGHSLSMDEALVLERNMCTVAFDTKERVAGMQAFLEKRTK